jgi:hypothetical protein
MSNFSIPLVTVLTALAVGCSNTPPRELPLTFKNESSGTGLVLVEKHSTDERAVILVDVPFLKITNSLRRMVADAFNGGIDVALDGSHTNISIQIVQCADPTVGFLSDVGGPPTNILRKWRAISGSVHVELFRVPNSTDFLDDSGALTVATQLVTDVRIRDVIFRADGSHKRGRISRLTFERVVLWRL